ncbi:MAG: endonuclease/exonuclease/phosphatase family protein [Mangrovicoccus sp.]|nr:endonuclease/exonuclease/phosphatase family protein [Mangrovicoccus sp.]
MRLILCLLCLWPLPLAGAETLRLALFNTELSYKGPGLLLRAINRGEAKPMAVAALVAEAKADAVLLLRFDWDLEGAALTAFAAQLAALGPDYPHRLALRPNGGLPSGLDLDGDGRRGGPGDAQGYGLFAGQNGMALLSRLPIKTGALRDFSAFLWRDLPGADLPQYRDGSPFPSAKAQAMRRLSSVGHWDIPLILPQGGQLHILGFHASPPVFDGSEDANGRRNGDELAFWRHYLDGALPDPPPKAPVVVIGAGNIDPMRGEGRRDQIRALLDHPRLQDPLPGQASVNWQGITEPPDLRVDYILPDQRLNVTGAGMIWPDQSAAGPGLHHALIWLDLRLP